MELTIANNKNSFDPTPKLKSSPIPILFVPFNDKKNYCNYCGNSYSTTFFYQKYCKNCLFWYIKYITDNNTYLDVHIWTTKQCIQHETARNTDFCPRNIQEWCEHCSEIVYFNQVAAPGMNKNEKYCKLCGKLIYQSNYPKFKLCPGCYVISSGWIESTLTKKSIPTLYLPWWDVSNECIACARCLNFTSDCQKWCSRCNIIYSGCRYCLTTNIIFGITNHSQCKKCKRTLSVDVKIDITSICSGNDDVDEFLGCIAKYNQIANYETNFKENSNPLRVYEFVKNLKTPAFKWYPFSKFSNLKKIAEGGFGIIYKATLNSGFFGFGSTTVAIKRFLKSQIIDKYFLNELKSNYQCNNDFIIKCFGITQDPDTKDYMLVMDYANNGDLHKYLLNNFTNITWNEKLKFLLSISKGLKSIHEKDFIHRDLHSGNLLSDYNGSILTPYKQIFQYCHDYISWKIGDLGLSQPVNKNSSNNEIYGVIPYVAPEIFEGFSFSKESDIYSMGMVMWELTTGCKPFADVEHDINLIYRIIDGERPEITDDTPECFSSLMKKCWDFDPSKRPSIEKICETISRWSSYYYGVYGVTIHWTMNYRYGFRNFREEFEQAEIKRLELIQSKKLGPEFHEKTHSKAIFTSRMLNSFISKSLSTNSTSAFSSTTKQEYITKEYELDINDIQRRNIMNPTIFLNAQHPNAIYNSRPLSEMISTVKNSRKRNNVELEIETQNNDKHVKDTNVKPDQKKIRNHMMFSQ